jgi:Holliday junction resolvasome RuvABC endonuclease subunit
MKRRAQKIIGINPGTRYIGIAVLYGRELMDWRIKVLEGKWSKEKITKVIRILSEIIERYEPGILAIKKLHPSRRSKNLLRLTNRIKEFVRRKSLKVYQYSIKEIENFYVKKGKFSKRNMFNDIIELYPELYYDQKKEMSQNTPYYYRMFEAIALAGACVLRY